MIESLRPYAQMKATAAEWLPNVPSHWQVRRIKTLLREVDARSTTGEEDLLSLRMAAGLIDHREAGGRPIPPDALIGFKKIQPEQIVMNRMRAASGLFGIARKQGIVSPDYAVFEQREDANLDYLLKLFKMPAMAAIFRAESKGLGTGESGFLRLYTDRFGPIPIPLPPVDEQRLINRFLDWHGAMTGRLVRTKKRLIGLLNEQKQSIIHRAVTRGLDPDAKLKPSGVDWLGDVPEGWEVKRLKRACRVGAGKGTLKGIDPDTFVSFLPMERVGADGSVDYAQMVPLNEVGSGFSVFRRDDVIVAKITPCFENGKGALLSSMPTEIGFGSSEFIVLRALAGLRPEFLYLLTSEGQFRRSGVEAMTGSAGQQRVPPEFIGNYVVALPPQETQVEICEFVNRESLEFEEAVDTIKDEIRLIHEFRTRLIADVVTGQLDVRAIAATLPDLTEEMVAGELPDDTGPDELADAAEDEEAAAA